MRIIFNKWKGVPIQRNSANLSTFNHSQINIVFYSIHLLESKSSSYSIFRIGGEGNKSKFCLKLDVTDLMVCFHANLTFLYFCWLFELLLSIYVCICFLCVHYVWFIKPFKELRNFIILKFCKLCKSLSYLGKVIISAQHTTKQLSLNVKVGLQYIFFFCTKR